MRIIAVERTSEELARLLGVVGSASPQSETVGFIDPLAALDAFSEQPAQAVVTELVLAGMTGFGFMEKLRALSPSVYVIFVTQAREFALDAFKWGANGYLLKPVNPSALRRKLEQARCNMT